jgi:hypothetical protein
MLAENIASLCLFCYDAPMKKVRLNLGCGYNKIEGWHNVDIDPGCKPDELVDLEKTPWPWENDSVEEIKIVHTLEHLGETPRAYLSIWKELYRVMAPGAMLIITVPHWRHNTFSHDPTHLRAITPEGVAMFDQKNNLEGIRTGNSETKLGLQTGVDFKLVRVKYTPDERWLSQYADRAPEDGYLESAAYVYNNVCESITMELEVIKPGRGT